MNTCVCRGWETNIEAIQPYLKEAPFRFCPWCGQRLASGQPDSTLLAQYRQRIEDSFFGTDEWGTPQLPNMLVAAQPIEDYRQVTADTFGTFDLMVAFVETGTRFTNELGDMDEPFYEGLELRLDNVRDTLLANPALYEADNIASRLTQLVRDAGDLGWGYGDYVTDEIAKIESHFEQDVTEETET